jgi:hypothetical protein
MANWERREADTLAEAIGKHRKGNLDTPHVNARLAVVQKAVDEAANTVATTAGDLHRHRTQVCAICRESNLKDCDVPHGWSDNCAFVRSNTDFGPL